MPVIDVIIQHHPSRAELVKRLTREVPGTRLIEDTGAGLNPWRGYRLCLEAIPLRVSHACILQDDVLVCKNFLPALERIADANPDIPVSLFLSRQPKRTFNQASLKYGKTRYVLTHPQDLVHVVAILWPVEKAREFLAWVDENPRRLMGRTFHSDDATVTRWMRMTRQAIRCTVPSIVEHPDDVPSTVNQNRVRNGNDAGRVAGYWIGDGDPLELDWSK